MKSGLQSQGQRSVGNLLEISVRRPGTPGCALLVDPIHSPVSMVESEIIFMILGVRLERIGDHGGFNESKILPEVSLYCVSIFRILTSASPGPIHAFEDLQFQLTTSPRSVLIYGENQRTVFGRVLST